MSKSKKDDLTRVYESKNLHDIIKKYVDSEAYDDYRELTKYKA